MNVGVWMLNYSTSSSSWSRSSGSTREQQGLARCPRDSADLPSSCPAHRKIFSLRNKFLWRQKRNTVSQKGSRDSSLHKPCFLLGLFRAELWSLVCPFLAGGLSL